MFALHPPPTQRIIYVAPPPTHTKGHIYVAAVLSFSLKLCFNVETIAFIFVSVTYMQLITCAATVCDLVGNSLVIQAVLNPSLAKPKAALRPAPPAPTTTAS